jgi:N-acetylglucosaminyl-diphospho-decaprenol L-rhamnosyltransferase
VTTPELSTIVVAWRAAEDVAELVADWPRDQRFELVVVDQDGDLGQRLCDAGLLPESADPCGNIRVLAPGKNLGFAGGSNYGARAARADRLFFLNPDARPTEGALAALSLAFDRWPEASGLVPRLVGFDGADQAGWQLRQLPTPLSLLAHALFWNPGSRLTAGLAAGTPIEQPAAAALALRRGVFEAVGGFDEGYFPAWFEDVDLARRLADRGHVLLYHPAALFRHRQGSSVGALGYGAFLSAYDRNLCRYLDRHHGHAWALAFRALAGPAALARLLLLPVRRPARTASRRQAAAALLQVARGSLSGWTRSGHETERPLQRAEPAA